MNQEKFLLITFAIIFSLSTFLYAQGCDLTGWRIFIDPGHGGSDPGAIGPTGLQEKIATLDTGLQLRDFLESIGVTVGMSRTIDIFVPLSTRATLANQFGADRFVSIHYNAVGIPSVNGTEVYVVPNPRPVTRDLGQRLVDYIVGYIGLPNRGLRFANFVVLVQTAMSAALSESSFISNPDEEQRLRDPAYRGFIAVAHNDGLCDHLGGFFGLVPDSEAPAQSDRADEAIIKHGPKTSGHLKILQTISGKKNFMAPKFSPNGKLIAFGEFGYKGIYIAESSNAVPEALASDVGAGFKFSWSPDSNLIAFTIRENAAYTVKLVDVRTREISVLLSHLTEPVRAEFLPDGDLLVLPDGPRKSASYRFNFSNHPNEASLPLLAFVNNEDGQVWVEHHGEQAQITDDIGTWYTDLQLNLKRDRILLNANNFEGSSLAVLNLTLREKEDFKLPVADRAHHNVAYQGSWCPDDKILLARTEDNGHFFLASDLYMIDGNKIVQLTNDGTLKLNPDCSATNQLAYDDGNGSIMIAGVLD